MERKISPDDESRMVGAIEKAATLASCKDKCDVNKVLADCLLEKHVDSRFAKTASAAFNRRLTVLKFQKADDAHRADSFGLSDSDSVYELMGGTPEAQSKMASEHVVGVFKMELVTPTEMVKVAAVESRPRYVRYEERVTVPVFERHLESIMDKQAAEFVKSMGELKSMEDSIARRKKELAAELTKVASFELSTLYSVYGDKFVGAFGDYLPKDIRLTKAAHVVPPETPLSTKVAELIDDMDKYAAFNNTMCDYKEWLGDFAKAAADTSVRLHKRAASFSTLTGMTTRGLSSLGLTGLQAAETVRRATNDAFEKGFGNARALYIAGDDSGMSPSKILDADFLAEDRRRDRMMGVSDLMADKYIAQFPARHVFLAANKAMDFDPSLEGPDKREVLKAQVGKLLMQNNRLNESDVAALATTLGAMGKMKPSVVEEAALRTGELDKVTRPEAPELNSIISMVNPELRGMDKDYGAEASKENTRVEDAEAKEEASKRDAEVKKLQEHNKEVAEANRTTETLAKEYHRALEQERRDRLAEARDNRNQEEQRRRDELAYLREQNRANENADRERWNRRNERIRISAERARRSTEKTRADADKTKAEAQHLAEQNRQAQLNSAASRENRRAASDRLSSLDRFAERLGLHRSVNSLNGKLELRYDEPSGKGGAGRSFSVDQVASMFDEAVKNSHL